MNKKLMKNFNVVKNFINNNKSISMKIIAGIIITITIAVIISCFNGKKYGNSVGNSNNYGLAVQNGNWIYYIKLDDEPVGIYKIKNNGKKVKKVIDGAFVGLNIIDNYIYCMEYDDEEVENNLVKIKTNGTDKEILARDIDEEPIMVVNKWIYYLKNDNLYRIKTDGTTKEKILDEEIAYYQIDGNCIYYIDSSGNIAKMKLNGGHSQIIAKVGKNEEYEALYVKNGKIYGIISKRDGIYDYDYYLYRMNENGKKQEEMYKIDKNIDYINMQENRIYYTLTEDYDTYEIKSIKYNGTDKKIIKEFNEAEYINITKDWIIFQGIDEEDDNIIKMLSIDGRKEKNL